MNVIDIQMTLPSPIWNTDHLRNDFQNAVRRNLHSWAKWRTKLNDNLVDAVMTGHQLTAVEPIRQFLNQDSPDPSHPTTNPKTLMTFSASSNSSTNLHRKDFYKYGIPRAKLDSRSSATAEQQANDQQETSTPTTSSFNLDTEYARIAHVFDIDGNEDDELVLDYFNYQGATNPATTSTSSSNSSAPRRRFHRSAAILPSPTEDVAASNWRGRRELNLAKKKKNNSEQYRLPPSYVEPFVQPRIIKARKDNNNNLYTRSAWLLDELQRD